MILVSTTNISSKVVWIGAIRKHGACGRSGRRDLDEHAEARLDDEDAASREQRIPPVARHHRQGRRSRRPARASVPPMKIVAGRVENHREAHAGPATRQAAQQRQVLPGQE